MPNFDDIVSRGMAGERISQPVRVCRDRLDPPAPKAPENRPMVAVHDSQTDETTNHDPIDAAELVASDPRYTIVS